MFRTMCSIATLLALTFAGCPTPDDDSTGDEGAYDPDDGDPPACVPCDGTISVYSEADLEFARGCSEIDGGLQFWDQEWLTEIDLPCLERTKWGVLTSGNPNLTTVNLPALDTTGTSFSFVDNPALVEVSAPVLTEANLVDFGRNDALTAIDLPELAATEELWITTNASLTDLTLPELLRVQGEVYIGVNPALTTLEIPRLSFTESDLQVSENDALTGLDGLGAVETVEGSLVIEKNQSLASLAGLTNLQRVGGVTILDNPCLDQSEADAFATAVSPADNNDVYGNDGPCE